MSGYLTTVGGENVPVRDGFVIGRVAGCDLVIQDGKASRRHARIVVAGGVAELEDLQSSNGTRLNDKPVTRRMLRDGDRIQIGATVLVYREGTAPAAAAMAPRQPAASNDDDDLLGGDAPASASPPAAAPAPAVARDEDDDDDLFADGPAAPPAPAPSRSVAPPPVSAPPPAPPKPPAPPASVVEFADEVVEVRKPAPAPTAKAPAAAAAGGATATSSGRILQYNKQAGGAGGPLGDDLGQLGGGARWLVLLMVLALGAGIVWLTIQMVR